MTQDLDSRQSTLIKAMRFPLICLVVFAHSAGAFQPPTVEWSLDGANVFHFVAEMLSRHFCSIGTCWFFVFSGYFFLRFLKDQDFNARWVAGKWKKRIRSLLIPFLLWNTLMVVIILLKNEVFDWLALGKNAGEMQDVLNGPLYWFFTGPIDFPLWFLRDLMLMSLLAPLLYLVFKRFPWVSLAVLVLVYLSPWDPFIPTMRSIFFFSLGAWLGTTKRNMLALCRKVKIPAAIGMVILLLAATKQVGRPLHTLLLRAFYPFGMVVFMNFCDRLIDNERTCYRLCDLAGAVFFIYAAHEIYVLGWTKGILLRLLGDSMAATWIRYFLVPVFVILICLVLYNMLNRIAPRALAFACGGRSQKKAK